MWVTWKNSASLCGYIRGHRTPSLSVCQPYPWPLVPGPWRVKVCLGLEPGVGGSVGPWTADGYM